MRVIASLLIMLIFSLTVAPAVAQSKDVHQEEMSCCDHDSNELNHENSCCDDTCNPFMSCCAQMGFTFENPLTFSSQEEVHKREIADLYMGQLLTHSEAFFVPPRV